MKTLIIFDSYFGNTEQLARAIGARLAGEHEVVCMRVGDVTSGLLSGVRLLIVGSPTRGFRPTPAISLFIEGIPEGGLKGVEVAAFDTRITPAEMKNILYTPLAKIFGYAAKPIAGKLSSKGGHLAIPPDCSHAVDDLITLVASGDFPNSAPKNEEEPREGGSSSTMVTTGLEPVTKGL